MPAGQAAARSSGDSPRDQRLGRPDSFSVLQHRHSVLIRSDPRLKQCFWKYKVEVFHFYHNPTVMYSVAALIVLNFIIECIQRQIDPIQGEKYPTVWRVFEVFFSVVFLIELLINMYGSWFKPFFSVGWNYFDIVVVAIGILVIAEVELPGPLSQILMLRAFRVFRLFNRIESLKKILLSIRHAIPGVLNAFIILALVMAIYSVLAVDVFRLAYEGSTEDTPNAYSSRGELYGQEYYGTFFKALYTLFQILTGESWSEAGVRPLLWKPGASAGESVLTAIFFLSFVLISSIILLNVVVAVLLDGMSTAGDDNGPVDTDDPKGEQDTRQELAHLKAELAEMTREMNDLLAAMPKGDPKPEMG